MSTKPRLSRAEVDERRRAILTTVAEVGDIRIADLADRFAVSLMTMHRDLDHLAEQMLLRKERGRAMAFPALTMETATRFREGVNLAEKTALCEAVARQVSAGDVLVIDDSSTLYPLAGALARAGVETVGVITNSVGIARKMASELPRADLTLLGGHYRGEFDSCTGPEVNRVLGRIRADLVLMSATAVHHGRLYHPLREYVEVKEAMLASARASLLVVDHSKFGKTATHLYGTAADYRTVFTDVGTPEDEIAALHESGASVDILEAPGSNT